MAELVLRETRDGVRWLTLNRPEAMNALSRPLRRALCSAIVEAAADEAVRVVIVTGAGTRAFCAGLDLKEMESDPEALGSANTADPTENCLAAFEACAKPIIGAINGFAITGGFELALACDMLIASDQARFADTHARVGLLPSWGLSQKLSRLVGPYRAREISLSGNFIDAPTAAAWGLVNRIVSADRLADEVQRLALDIASADPATVAALKGLMNRGYGLDLDAALALEQRVSKAWNGAQSGDAVAARRTVLQARAREQ